MNSNDWQILDDEVSILEGNGDYKQAALVAQKAVKAAERCHGRNHLNVATALDRLAELYWYMLDQPAKAKAPCRRALAIRQKALGTDHPETATSMNNLAALLDTLAKFSEAEPLYRQSLAIHEKLGGADDPDVAIILVNLGDCLAAQDRFAEAEVVFSRALRIRKRVFAKGHASTVETAAKLAEVRARQVQAGT